MKSFLGWLKADKTNGINILVVWQTLVLSLWCQYFFDHAIWHWVMLVFWLATGYGLGHLLHLSYSPLSKKVTIAFLLFLSVFGSYLLFQIRPYTSYFIPLVCILQIISGTMLGSTFDHLQKNPIAAIISLILLAFIPFASILWTDVVWMILSILVFFHFFSSKKAIIALSLSAILFKVIAFPAITLFNDQQYFQDKIVEQCETPQQSIHVTTWKNDYFTFINHKKSFSTVDAALYYEPMTHVPASFAKTKTNILILGGENGLLAHELLRYQEIKSIDIIPYDTTYINQAKNDPLWQQINGRSLVDNKITIYGSGLMNLPEDNTYDLIYVDLPDPSDEQIAYFYSIEFYTQLASSLKSSGIMITQSGAYEVCCRMHTSIVKAWKSMGYETTIIHNQIPTIGHWSWVIASDYKLTQPNPLPISCKWLNQDALTLLMNSGRQPSHCDDAEISRKNHPVIIQYATPINP